MKKLHLFDNGTWAITDDDGSTQIEQNGAKLIQTIDATEPNFKAHNINVPSEHEVKPKKD